MCGADPVTAIVTSAIGAFGSLAAASMQDEPDYSSPSPPPAPPAVTEGPKAPDPAEANQKAAEARAREQARIAAKQGYSSTILTGGQGLGDENLNLGKKSLLGE